MAVLPRPVMMMIWSQPEAMASSTPYWMMGLSTNGSISFGCALVAGRKRVPSPAAGNTALRTFFFINFFCRRRTRRHADRQQRRDIVEGGGASAQRQANRRDAE